MRITVIEFAPKGGLAHYAHQLCEAMQNEGAEVTLLTSAPYELEPLRRSFTLERSLHLWDPKPEQERAGPLRRRARRVARGVRYYAQWRRALQRVEGLGSDVVQLGDIRFATDLLPIARARRRAPILADICHNVRPFAGGAASNGTFGLSQAERAAFARIYRCFDAVFVHYRPNAEEFARTFPESASRVVPIVHGNEALFEDLADPDVDAPTIRRTLGLSPTDRVVLFFGTLSAYKGLDLLSRAFEIVASAVPGAVLVIAGYPLDGFNAARYLGDASRRGFGERLRIAEGYVDSGAVAGWMELAEVVVFPYHTVYQSGALHVAHTFGKPIVATRVGAMAEVIDDGRSGVLVPPEDPEAFAAATIRLLRDRRSAAQLGAEAARDARTRFGWRSVGRSILARYEALLEERER